MEANNDTLVTLTPWAPLLLGGALALIRPWVKKGEDAIKAARLARAKAEEQVSLATVALLDHSRNLQLGDHIRGDGFNSPDLVGALTTQSVNMHRLNSRLDMHVCIVLWTNRSLLYSCLAAVAFALSTSAFESSRHASGFVTATIIVAQLALVWGNFRSWSRINEMEGHD